MSTPVEQAAFLTAQGYCRVSWKHGGVARIDREDWVQHMAKELRRAPADFYVPGDSQPSGSWASFYRSVYSKDVLWNLPREVIALIPTSGHNSTGFIHRCIETETLLLENKT